jgi:dTMP kinase
MSRSGALITFEGIDGSGKSTQAALLRKFLSDKGYSFEFVREPGGTGVSEAIRKILLDKRHGAMDSRTELLLFLAARAELIGEVIVPAIAAGKIVIADRFSDSTFAYQIYGRRLPERTVRQINAFVTDKIKPDLTFLVDLDVGRARQRLKQQKDRMESAEMAFHRRVRAGFLEIAGAEPNRLKLLDGRCPPDEIWQEVKEMTLRFLHRRKIEPHKKSSR